MRFFMQFGKVDIYLCTCFNLLLHFCILKFKYNLIFLLFKQKSGGGGGGKINTPYKCKKNSLKGVSIKTKKLLVSSVVALVLSSSALVGEESGAFFGVGIGHGAGEREYVENGAKDKAVGAGASYEIIAGYKQFFTSDVGLRYYANFTYANFNDENPGKTTLMNYGVNVDALFNFITSESANFGAFVGVGVGSNTIDNKDFSDIQAAGINLKKTGLDVSLNLGLRSVVDTKHSLEAIVRVPLVAMTLFDGNVAGTQVKLTASRNYNIGVRYIYSF